MFEFWFILIPALTIILVKIFLNIDFKKMKKIELDTISGELSELSEKFPSDEKICKDILKKLNNEKTEVKVDNNYTNCLYTIFNNKITIGKFKQDYMKIQTIAHECIHSTQNKVTLWSNFIFSNIYLIYFVVILILTLFNKLPNTNIFMIALIFMSFIQYIIRNTLETEAMLKAKYLAKEYIEENRLLNKEEEVKLMEEYDRVNNIGIPFINYYNLTMNLIKVIIYAFVMII